MHYQMDILKFIRNNIIFLNNTYQHNNTHLSNCNHLQHLLMLQILKFLIVLSFETKSLYFECNFLKFLPMQNMEHHFLLLHTCMKIRLISPKYNSKIPDWFPHNYRKLIKSTEHVDYLKVFG